MEFVVIGAANTDLVTYSPHFPVPGETLIGHNFHTAFGGKAGNIAVQAAKLYPQELRGTSVALVACLGRDHYGVEYAKYLKEVGLSTEGLFFCDDPQISSGIAAITVAPDGENTIIVTRGANELLGVKELMQENIARLIRNCTILCCQNEIDLTVSLEAFKLSRVSEKLPRPVTIFSPSPAILDEPEIFLLSDFIIMSRLEGEQLCGIALPYSEDDSQGVQKLNQPQEEWLLMLRNFILESGRRCLPRDALNSYTGNVSLVVTSGALPCLVAVATHTNDPCPTMYKVPVPERNSGPIINTVGAGDSFVGAFAYFLCRQHPVDKAVKAACTIAGYSIRMKSTSSGYATRDDLQDVLEL